MLIDALSLRQRLDRLPKAVRLSELDRAHRADRIRVV
jgi:hypothetical protein